MGCDHRHIGTQYLSHCIFTTLLVRTLETMGEKENMWEWGELKTNSITVFVGGNSFEVI